MTVASASYLCRKKRGNENTPTWVIHEQLRCVWALHMSGSLEKVLYPIQKEACHGVRETKHLLASKWKSLVENSFGVGDFWNIQKLVRFCNTKTEWKLSWGLLMWDVMLGIKIWTLNKLTTWRSFENFSSFPINISTSKNSYWMMSKRCRVFFFRNLSCRTSADEMSCETDRHNMKYAATLWIILSSQCNSCYVHAERKFYNI